MGTAAGDILFVIDNSCSMSEEQAALGNNFGNFIGTLTQQNIDFQIGVTTTDVDSSGEQGRLVEPSGVRIVRPSTPNAASVLAANVQLGTNGSYSEKGLEAAYLALSDPLINTHNAGFVRTGASLAVIVLSDEEDSSSRPLPFYESFFGSLKGPSGRFAFHAIVGTRQPNCSGPGGRADYGARYIQVAQNSGGLVDSICNTTWGPTLDSLAAGGFGRQRQFVLSSAPVASTIAVLVDGVTVPSVSSGGTQHWSYSQSTNSVDFGAGAIPAASATIDVEYTVACLP